MGCGSSSDLGGARRRVNGIQANSNAIMRGGGGVIVEDVDASNMIYFDEILLNVDKVVIPNNIAPIVCSLKNAFPLFSKAIPKKDDSEASISLPIMAASIIGKERIICFPHIRFFDQSIFNKKDTRQLICNSLDFLSKSMYNDGNILAVGFSKLSNDLIADFFQDIEASVTISQNLPENISEYCTILIPASFNIQRVQKEINDFLGNSGGLGVLFDPEGEETNFFQINQFLNKKGLNYVPASIDFGTDGDVVNLTNDFSMMKDMNLLRVIQKFKTVLHQKHLNNQYFSDRIDLLKMYIAACSMFNNIEIISCYRSCIKFLERGKFVNNGEICQNETQRSVANLVLYISENIPPENCIVLPNIEKFPGKCVSETNENEFAINCDVDSRQWTSTGLWLTPGHAAEIQFQDDDWEGILIQVGSHTEDLTESGIPWKRWPIVVRTFTAFEPVTFICSSTGGIVYLSLEKNSKPKSITAKFYGCIQHPRALLTNQQIWDDTCFSMTPWCEFDCDNIVFTLPTTVSREADLQWVLKTYNNIINCTWDMLLVEEIDRIPYRVVFDVDLLHNRPVCGYPFIFLIEDAPKMITMSKIPTESVFTLVTLVVISIFKKDAFSDHVETGVASALTHIILEKEFGAFDLFTFEDTTVNSIYVHLVGELHKNEKDTVGIIIEALNCSDNGGDSVLTQKLSITFPEKNV